MRPETLPADASASLAPRTATEGQPRRSASLSLASPQTAGRRALLARIAGNTALLSLVAGTLLLAVFATGQASTLVPRSALGFPGWESGPLHFLFGHPTLSYSALNTAFSIFLLAMAGVYVVMLLTANAISLRAIVATVVAVNLLLLLLPPLQLTDLFNYLGYARLGAIHHLNPYVQTIRSETFDPVFGFSRWHNLRSPYGPLFTAITYPVAFLSIPAAYWTIKVLIVLSSLGLVAAVWWCARRLGRDPRYPVLFVAANPIYLFFGVGGFHNDFLMMLPAVAAVGLLLTGRERGAGAMLMLAVGIKLTAVVLLPFLLISSRHRRRALEGAGLAAASLVALSLFLFGVHLPNVSQQSSLLTQFSLPNLIGLAAGVGGGTPTVLHIADLAMIPALILCLRRTDRISGMGYATLALLCTFAWLMPWYIVWVLPLAALGSSVRLRQVTLGFALFLLITFLPVTPTYLANHRIGLLRTAAGEASLTLQAKLAK